MATSRNIDTDWKRKTSIFGNTFFCLLNVTFAFAICIFIRFDHNNLFGNGLVILFVPFLHIRIEITNVALYLFWSVGDRSRFVYICSFFIPFYSFRSFVKIIFISIFCRKTFKIKVKWTDLVWFLILKWLLWTELLSLRSLYHMISTYFRPCPIRINLSSESKQMIAFKLNVHLNLVW